MLGIYCQKPGLKPGLERAEGETVRWLLDTCQPALVPTQDRAQLQELALLSSDAPSSCPAKDRVAPQKWRSPAGEVGDVLERKMKKGESSVAQPFSCGVLSPRKRDGADERRGTVGLSGKHCCRRPV